MSTRPIVFVHGYSASERSFARWREILEQKGYEATSIHVSTYQSLTNEVTVRNHGTTRKVSTKRSEPRWTHLRQGIRRGGPFHRNARRARLAHGLQPVPSPPQTPNRTCPRHLRLTLGPQGPELARRARPQQQGDLPRLSEGGRSNLGLPRARPLSLSLHEVRGAQPKRRRVRALP